MSSQDRSQRRTERKVPDWDAQRRELRWQGQVVKRFRQPAPSQEMILRAAEELGWPEWFDDPLPRVPGLNPKARLHDTIRNLNRHQQRRLLHFKGDGTGTRVGWECR